MKIGILTYHRAHNYGAILQAIAMRVVLHHLNHEVYYVDYYPQYHRNLYKLFSWALLFRWRRKYLVERFKYWKAIRKRIACFERDINQYISPFCIPYNSNFFYDVVIYGSDQIWRKQKALNGFNPVYFGENTINTKKHVTYAASMGILQKSELDKCFLKDRLCRFSAISVREKELLDYLNELGFQAELSLDPTLLLTSAEWDKALNLRPITASGYVLFYSLHEEAFSTVAIRRFAESRKLRMIEVKGKAGKDSEKIYSQCGAWEFVSLIKNADYVFSTSYHGLAFSLIYHKDFYCAFKKNAGRAQGLLEQLNLQERLLEVRTSEIPIFPTIDYCEVDQQLNRLRKKSLNYIEKVTT